MMLNMLHQPSMIIVLHLVFVKLIYPCIGIQAHVFNYNSRGCCAFLANYNLASFAKVAFRGMHYNLPPWSISILPDCKNTVFNTTRVGSQSAQMKMTPTLEEFSWQSYNEEAAYHSEGSNTVIGLLEQINITRDATDYLWYMTDVNIDSNEEFLKNGQYPVLTVLSAGHALHVFVNGQLSGTMYGSLEDPKLTFSSSVKLSSKTNRISLLSVAIGRYWPAYKTRGNCGNCSYIGTYDEKKCQKNCGEASQRWYHVPRAWLKPTGNLLVVFEEMGGNPYGISLVTRAVESVCADIFEWQPTLLNYWRETSDRAGRPIRPKAHLRCAPGQKISSIKFASFGTPQGACGSFSEGRCHAHKSYDALEKRCIGQQACSVTIAPEVFGGDPCPDILKKLSVEAICS